MDDSLYKGSNYTTPATNIVHSPGDHMLPVIKKAEAQNKPSSIDSLVSDSYIMLQTIRQEHGHLEAKYKKDEAYSALSGKMKELLKLNMSSSHEAAQIVAGELTDVLKGVKQEATPTRKKAYRDMQNKFSSDFEAHEKKNATGETMEQAIHNIAIEEYVHYDPKKLDAELRTKKGREKYARLAEQVMGGKEKT